LHAPVTMRLPGSQGARALDCCSLYVLMAVTRGDVLRDRIAFALSRAAKIVRGLRQALTEAERYAVADHVVEQLNQRGDPWRLSEDAPTNNGMPTTR
jgi:hypothetical protein